MYRVFTCMRGVEIVGRSNANQLEEKRRVSLGQTSTEDPEGCTLGDCHIKLQRCWGCYQPLMLGLTKWCSEQGVYFDQRTYYCFGSNLNIKKREER